MSNNCFLYSSPEITSQARAQLLQYCCRCIAWPEIPEIKPLEAIIIERESIAELDELVFYCGSELMNTPGNGCDIRCRVDHLSLTAHVVKNIKARLHIAAILVTKKVRC